MSATSAASPGPPPPNGVTDDVPAGQAVPDLDHRRVLVIIGALMYVPLLNRMRNKSTEY